ncbi:MAG: hypothetical protein R2724_34670 [Bryobacterales bacterium]
MAQVLEMMRQEWIKAGPDAKDIFLIQQLETVIGTVTDRVKQMEIGEVTLLDGGKGEALPQHMAALPATVGAVLKQLRETTGVDVTGILAGVNPGDGGDEESEAVRRRQQAARAAARGGLMEFLVIGAVALAVLGGLGGAGSGWRTTCSTSASRTRC